MSSTLTLGPRLSVFQPTLFPFCPPPPFYSHQERRRDRNDFQRVLPPFPSSAFIPLLVSLFLSSLFFFLCPQSSPQSTCSSSSPPRQTAIRQNLAGPCVFSPLFSPPPHHSFSPLQNGAILPGLNLRISQGGKGFRGWNGSAGEINCAAEAVATASCDRTRLWEQSILSSFPSSHAMQDVPLFG